LSEIWVFVYIILEEESRFDQNRTLIVAGKKFLREKEEE